MPNWSIAHYQNGLEQGREEGRLEGREEGEINGALKELKAVIQRMVCAGFTFDMIAIATDKDIDEIQTLLQQ